MTDLEQKVLTSLVDVYDEVRDGGDPWVGCPGYRTGKQAGVITRTVNRLAKKRLLNRVRHDGYIAHCCLTRRGAEALRLRFLEDLEKRDD